MTPCFPCVHCLHSPQHNRLWCHLHRKDARRRCADYLREAGIDE